MGLMDKLEKIEIIFVKIIEFLFSLTGCISTVSVKNILQT